MSARACKRTGSRSSRWFACLLLALASAGVRAAGAATTQATPAQWRSYDILVQLQDLPKTYSCTDLWYKFRDVLLRIGARQYMTIEPYRCGLEGGGQALSPSVQLRFQLPQPLRADEARYADTSSVERVIRLAPGEPRSLQAGDCELVRQVQSALLRALPVRITDTDLHCAAPRDSFRISLDAAVAASPPRPPPARPHS